MLNNTWNAEWLNENTQRKYPLHEAASAKDTSGGFTLPDNFIVDMAIGVNATITTNPELFYISQVGVFSGGITVSFAYNGVVFSTVNITVSTFTKYSTYRINGTGDYEAIRGWVTIGEIDEILKYGGAWSFDAAGAMLTLRAIVPDIKSIASITVVNGSEESTPLTGAITLRAGQNMTFAVDLSGASPEVTMSAANGLNLESECECNNLDNLPPCIRSINGVVPSEEGNIQLIGSTCIDFTNGDSIITIKDECSEPCCDCRELEVVTATMIELQRQVLGLELSAETLERVIRTMNINLTWPR